jgi:hypothetical protein
MKPLPPRDLWPVFARFPESWIGRTVEIWADGAYTLDSGLFSKERKSRGELPKHTLRIEPALSGGEIMAWLLHFHASPRGGVL